MLSFNLDTGIEPQFKISLSQDDDSLTINFPKDLGNFKNHVYIQQENEPLVPLANSKENKVNLPRGGDQKKCKIIIKDDKEKGDPNFEHVLAEFKVPAKGDAKFSYEGNNAPRVNGITTFDIKSTTHTGIFPKKVNKDAHERLSLTTDLHSHFAAVPTAQNLIDMATLQGERPFYFPIELLEKIGIKTDKYKDKKNAQDLSVVMQNAEVTKLKEQDGLKQEGVKNDKWGLANQDMLKEKKGPLIDINSLGPEDKEIFINNMSIHPTKQITFDDMENFYTYREPFIKNIDFLESLLTISAKNYAKAGVKQVSLSFSSRICNPQWLAIADRVLPKLEEQYGVKMRFLVGMSRLMDNDQQEDVIQQFKSVADHPCIEGVDVFASEINSTYDFYLPLSKLGKWCNDNGYSDKVIRIHAGETPYHPENVYSAVALANETGIRVRLGHGLFGSVDDEVIKLIDESDLYDLVIMEMCLDSNYSLNHIDNTYDHSLIKLAESGVPVVMGSDGGGLYYSDAKQLAKHIDRLGIKAPEKLNDLIEHVKKTETFYSSVNTHAYENAKKKLDAKLEDRIKTAEKQGKSKEEARESVIAQYYKEQAEKYKDRFWTREKMQLAQAKKEKKQKAVNDHLIQNKVKLLPTKDGAIAFPEGKIPVMITGGLLDSTTNDQRAEIAGFIKTLIESCDPKKVCFVTSGNEHGLQKLLHHELANAGFDVVGLVAKNAKPKDLTSTMTHAVLEYERWYDMHGYIGKQLEHNKDFQVMLVGGNMLTRHIAQTSVNIISQGDLQCENKQLYCVKGIPGAANDKAEHLPSQFSVQGTKGLLTQFYKNMENKGALKIPAEEAMKKLEKNTESYKGRDIPHGDMDAVDAKDRANYFIKLGTSLGIKVDGKLLNDQSLKKEIKAYFISGCSVHDPFAFKLLGKDNLEIIQKNKMQQHFSKLGIPNLSNLSDTMTMRAAADQEFTQREKIEQTHRTNALDKALKELENSIKFSRAPQQSITTAKETYKQIKEAPRNSNEIMQDLEHKATKARLALEKSQSDMALRSKITQKTQAQKPKKEDITTKPPTKRKNI